MDQLAEVGFEMIFYSFGSAFNIENRSSEYIESVRKDIAYANSKGIEVGGYDLIALSRVVQDKWMAQGGKKGDHNACFASGWLDFLTERVSPLI